MVFQRLQAGCVVAFLLVFAGTVLGSLLVAGGASTQPPRPVLETGWSISSFVVDVTVRADGRLAVREAIDAHFDQPKHGIYRDIPVTYAYDQQHDRVLQLSGIGVTDALGHQLTFSTQTAGSALRIKIGDPNRTVAGSQSYVITYDVRGALNGFPDHDELNWNATGNYWGVPIEHAEARVHPPFGSLGPVTCFEGYAGSTTPCAAQTASGSATFTAGQLAAGQGLTFVVSLAKGAVPDPQPILEAKPRTFAQFFDLSPLDLGLLAAVLLAAAGAIAYLWRAYARDLRAAGDPETVVPEFTPPDGLRPAQVGLVLDESADTKDVTATIIDLAARGYLSIQELAESGFLHSASDYLLKKGAADPAQLQPFESVLWHGLFDGRDEVRLSTLRGTFKPKLDEAEGDMYRDAMRRGWFVHDPRLARTGWVVAGVVVILAGVGLTVLLGQAAGLGLPGAGLVAAGLVVVALHGRMPQRTRTGHQLLRGVLGYRMYMTTAERYLQQFAEKEKVFTAGLPYAIVFGCVDRWARAFQGIDLAAATAGWYIGGSYLNALAFSSALQGFSNTVGSSIAYAPPAASGASGFGGGGFSGGGFGGGGGGSW